MKKLLLALPFVLLSNFAIAANTSLSNLTAGASVAGTDLFYDVKTPGSGGVKITGVQLAAYIYGLMSGDATASGTGGLTLASVNGNVGSFGSATQCITTTQNAKGLTTAISQATCTPAVGSITGLGTGVATALAVNVGTAGAPVVNGGALGTPSSGVATNLTGTAAGLTAGNVTTNANLTGAVTSSGNATSLGSFSSANLLAALSTKTGTGNNVFGTAPTIDSLNATTAMTLAFLTGSTQCLQVNTSGAVSGTGSACGSGGGTGANPTATAGSAAINGVATTFMRSDAAPAVATATSSVLGLVKPDGITIANTAGAITVPVGCGLNTSSGTAAVNANIVATNNTATTDTITNAMCGTTRTESNALAVAVAITTAGFASGNYFTSKNLGVGTATYTPSSGTINGAATLACSTGQSFDAYFDGTNFVTLSNTCGISGGGTALGLLPYISGDYYTSWPRDTWGSQIYANGNVNCRLAFFKGQATVDTLGMSVAIATSGGNFQVAIYALNANQLPTGNPLAKTGSLSTTSLGTVIGAVNSGTPIQLGSASSSFTPYAYCIMVDATAQTGGATFIATANAQAGQSADFGSPSAAIALNSSGGGYGSVSVSGQTFGTWPNLTSASFNQNDFGAPVHVFHLSSVP